MISLGDKNEVAVRVWGVGFFKWDITWIDVWICLTVVRLDIYCNCASLRKLLNYHGEHIYMGFSYSTMYRRWQGPSEKTTHCRFRILLQCHNKNIPQLNFQYTFLYFGVGREILNPPLAHPSSYTPISNWHTLLQLNQSWTTWPCTSCVPEILILLSSACTSCSIPTTVTVQHYIKFMKDATFN